MLDRIQTEAERLGKAGLRHLEPVADALHIHFIRHVYPEVFPLSAEKRFDLVQSGHEFFKRGLHHPSPDVLSPVGVKNFVSTLLQRVALGLGQIAFLFFGKTVIRKTGNLSLRQIYTTRAPPLFPMPWRGTRTFRNPPVPDITSPH